MPSFQDEMNLSDGATSIVACAFCGKKVRTGAIHDCPERAAAERRPYFPAARVISKMDTGAEGRTGMRKVMVKRGDKQVEADIIPFRIEQETFSIYEANVEEGHPLFGRTIKMRNAALKILYLGDDERGEPIVQVQSQQLVTVE